MEPTEQKAAHFWCNNCKVHWQTNEYKVDEAGETYSHCPECKSKCNQVGPHYANLAIMKQNATGPKTEKGKARSSANAYKHGNYAKTARMLAPAAFGKYPECKNCEHTYKCEFGDIKHCPEKLEPMLRFLQAVEEKDPEALKMFAGMNLGKTNLALNSAFSEIIDKGILIKSYKVLKNGDIACTPEGNPIEEFTLNPALKVVPEFMKILGMDADSQQLTPKSKVETDALEGILNKDIALSDYMKTLSMQLSSSPLLARNQTNNNNQVNDDQPETEAEEEVQITMNEAPNESPFTR